MFDVVEDYLWFVLLIDWDFCVVVGIWYRCGRWSFLIVDCFSGWLVLFVL